MSGQTFSCWFEFLSFAVIQRGPFFTPFSWWNLNLMSSNTIQVCCNWQIHQSGILYPMTATSHKLGYISTHCWAWLNPNFHLSNFIGWTQHPNIFHGFPCFNLYFHHLKTLVFVPFFMFFSWFPWFFFMVFHGFFNQLNPLKANATNHDATVGSSVIVGRSHGLCRFFRPTGHSTRGRWPLRWHHASRATRGGREEKERWWNDDFLGYWSLKLRCWTVEN